MEENEVRECIRKAVTNLGKDLSKDVENEIADTAMSYSDPPDEGLVQELVLQHFVY